MFTHTPSSAENNKLLVLSLVTQTQGEACLTSTQHRCRSFPVDSAVETAQSEATRTLSFGCAIPLASVGGAPELVEMVLSAVSDSERLRCDTVLYMVKNG
jgi:hypothetical protein